MDFLIDFYPWAKSLHIMSVISWMAGLFYLPRLFVHHTEQAQGNSDMSEVFKMMERKLFKFIMNPAMVSTWIFGLILAFTPGVVDIWGDIWFHIKFLCISVMTWFHHWLGYRLKDFRDDKNGFEGKYYRRMNEVPTVLMIVIVFMVILKPVI